MELFAYTLLALIGLMFAWKSPRNVDWVSAFFILLAFAIVVRLSGFDSDIKVYASTMKLPTAAITGRLYFMREWFFWLTTNVLFKVIRNAESVFLFCDALLIATAIWTLKSYELPSYSIVLFFVIFPSVFGLQNVYRQFSATIIFMASVASIARAKKLRGVLLFTLSVFTHNVMALFLPVFVLHLLWKSRRVAFYVFVATLISFAGIYVFAGTKSSAQTGLDLSLLYLFVFVAGVSAFGYIKLFRVTRSKDAFQILVVGAVLVGAFLGLSSAQSERVSFVAYQVMFPSVLLAIEAASTTRTAWGNRTVFAIAMVAPVFLFSSSLLFLV